eukprot:CAMPEP_0169151396 /NCGR_PEP_ID=MMETSP1015-20121227/50801_1 /TAXON_ID=342587 /ORGANISM="Karlodinium micrum, Strain CCMP2283" /LENGTH=138 /DNA_ID=CAMNT_0009220807 /DNA_START=66 /DNA_END=479 /DNA_ORIENTATION=+
MAADSSLSEVMRKRSKRPEVANAVVEFLQEKQIKVKLPEVVLRVSRPPGHIGGSNAPHGDFAYELVLPYIVLYAELDQLADIVVSADPYITFPSANFLTSKKLKVVREKDDAFEKKAAPCVVSLVQGKEHSLNDIQEW